MDYRIIPPDGYIEGHFSLPLSKSMSNRAFIISALTADATLPDITAECDDTIAMQKALTQGGDTVDVGAAGTAMRFLTAYYASQPGVTVTLDGSERMRQRPIGPLVDALRQLGADIEYAGEEGYPPLRIAGTRLSGGEIALDATVSSQYVSALLMIAPTMEHGLRLKLEGEAVSTPYIKMTLQMMEAAGVEAERLPDAIIVESGQSYTSPTLDVEPDWSAAAFAYEIQAIGAGETDIDGLQPESCQGDSRVSRIFEQLGVSTEWDDDSVHLTASPESSPRLTLDMSDTPDLVPAVVVTCCMLGIPFHLTGLETLRIKECDRVDALMREMLKCGLILSAEAPGVLTWEGQRRPMEELPVFDTYDDHRMAMALAPVAIFLPGIVIRDAGVVAKSFPDYWRQLESMGFRLLDPDTPLDNPGEEDAEA